MSRFRLDRTVARYGTVVVGGSPLRLFRLTERGAEVVESIERGDDVAPSKLTDALVAAGAAHPVPGSAVEFSRDDVTVVVPTLGRADHAPPGSIVVDDGSEPPVPGATVRLDQNRGPAGARNAGLRQVNTALVAFVDADVIVPDDWLDPLLPHFDDHRVALVAPRVRSRADTSRHGAYDHDHGPLDLGDEPARVRAGTRVSYVPAAAIVCRTDAIRAIGGFDETLRFGEDVDLVWRLDRAGWGCRYEPSVEVGHEPRPDLAGWVRQRIGYGSSAAPLARRHPGALAPLRMSGWSLAAWILAAIGRPVTGGILAAGTAAALVPKLADLPPQAAFGLAARGHVRAGGQIATAVRRCWWPVLGIAALRSRTARRVLAMSALASRSPWRLADDVAYSLGVWTGVIRERTPAPLIPEIVSWPGRRSRPTDPLPSVT